MTEAVGPSPWTQYCVLTARCGRLLVAEKAFFAGHFKAITGMSTLIGLVFWQNAGTNQFVALATYIPYIFLSLMTNVTFSNILPLERGLVDREYRNGVYSATVYYWARLTVAIAATALVAAATTPWWWFLVGLPFNNAGDLLIAIASSGLMAVNMCAFATVMGVVITDPVALAQVSVPVTHVILLFGGATQSIKDTPHFLRWLIKYLPMSHGWFNLMTRALNREAEDQENILLYYSISERARYGPSHNFTILLSWFAIFAFVANFIIVRVFASLRTSRS